MVFYEYSEKIKEIAPAEGLAYHTTGFCLRPSVLPLVLVSSDGDGEIIRVPAQVKNSFGNEVNVVAVARSAFTDNKTVTDIILPASIERIEASAFAGCEKLQNITIPKGVTRISAGTFSGCISLQNVYYEGSRADWERVEIAHDKHEIEFGTDVPGTPAATVPRKANWATRYSIQLWRLSA